MVKLNFKIDFKRAISGKDNYDIKEQRFMAECNDCGYDIPDGEEYYYWNYTDIGLDAYPLLSDSVRNKTPKPSNVFCLHISYIIYILLHLLLGKSQFVRYRSQTKNTAVFFPNGEFIRIHYNQFGVNNEM